MNLQRTLHPCAHCGTEFTSTGRNLDFCCAGCEAVYSLLHSEGLQKFYELKEEGQCLLPAQLPNHDFLELEDPKWLIQTDAQQNQLEFFVEGLSCAACVWLLEKLPEFCSDCDWARVNLHRSTVLVGKTPTGSFAAIARVIGKIGYSPHPLRLSEDLERHQRNGDRLDLLRLAVAGAAAGNIMLMSVAIYAGADLTWTQYFSRWSAALALPVLTWSAWPFYKNAAQAFIQRRLNIDVPIVLALVAGSITSVHSLIGPSGETYFDSLTLLVFLLSSSRYFLKRIQAKFLLPTYLEEALLSGSVLRKRRESDKFETVSFRSVCAGDTVQIKADQIIPFDGILQSAVATVEMAYLTGELTPLPLSTGASIASGMRALSSMEIKVSVEANDSSLIRGLRAAALDYSGRPRWVDLSEQVGQWFLVSVLGAAALVIFRFFLTGQLAEGIHRGLALAIVTCPCVFGFAIPLAHSLSLQLALRHGIFIGNSEIWERLLRIRNIFFDKTGTLTTGQLEIVEVKARPEMTEADWQVLLAMETSQSHPVARAIAQHCLQIGIPSADLPLQIQRLPQGGVMGDCQGSLYSVLPSAEISKNLSEIRGHYQFMKNQTLLLTFVARDQIREGMVDAVRKLASKNLRLGILSGDQASAVNAVARSLGLDLAIVHSKLNSAQKAAIVRSQQHPALVIGDGSNDAQALGAAAVGLAVQGGLDCSLGVADAYVSPRQMPTAIVTLFDLAHKLRKTLLRNLVFATAFNITAGTLALAGLMSPLLAAVLMPTSSLIVLFSTLRGLR